MSRNSFDEGDDKITPLARTFTATEEGQNILRAGDFAAGRRKNSIHRSGTTGGFSRSKSVKETSSRKDQVPQRANTLSNKGFAPSRSKSLRAPPPPKLQLKKNELGVPEGPPAFPSPGRAPMGQRIFDAQEVAKDSGMQVAEGGWALDKRTQDKLDAERKRIEAEEKEHMMRGEDGELKHNKSGRTRRKSFKEILLRR